jgi:hypothetical protein
MLAEASDNIGLMQLSNTPDDPPEMLIPSGKRNATTEPSFEGPPKLIAEFAGQPDFPKCALGEFVDIGGYAGVVVEIVKQSIKVRAPEGTIQSFNYNWLRKLYCRVIQSEISEMTSVEAPPVPAEERGQTTPPIPKRDVITKPNFDRAVKGISVFACRSDFPRCAFGEFVDIGGYTGVVVENVNRSLKVMSPEGSLRSYNADVLRKLYGQGL